jgi:sigma-B regulation protein RsbU (phosphoserine phosphatase)
MHARILIADDYEDNLELLRLLLSGAGYEVLEARDGQECLEKAAVHLPDLIIIDLSMPKRDGWEVFTELKANPLTSAIPCVAATASASLERARALECGFDAYLNKPFHTSELLAVVEKMLKSSMRTDTAVG